MSESIMDRMKRNYELPARRFLTRRTPVIVRVDGRAFHTFTKQHGFKKPFDYKLIESMQGAAIGVANEMQGFKMGYVQSDEASFVLTDYDNLDTDAWFGYVQNKVESISAALMTANFGRNMRLMGITTPAVFDARAFNIPEDEVVNYFLARALDWKRNSVQMLAGAHFSHKQLHKKTQADMHEMLHNEGVNWAHLDDVAKNGTFLLKKSDWGIGKSGIEINEAVLPGFGEISNRWERVMPL